MDELRTFFCRVGNKTPLLPTIEKLLPKDIKIFVELFVGSGAVFWGLPNTYLGEHQVLNDLDSNVVESFRLLKSANTDTSSYYVPPTLVGLNRFVNTKQVRPQDKLIKRLITSCNTFGNTGRGKIYKDYQHTSKIEKIPLYKQKLKTATISNADYIKVLKQTDSKGTFFFLDPPYEESGTLYKHNEGGIDFEEMRKVLANIKGRFMLTINDSKYIRDVFREFKIIPVVVRGGAFTAENKINKIGGQNRKELIIINY